MTPLLSPGEVAERLGCAPKTLSAWRCRGYGPPYTKTGAGVRYPESELEARLESTGYGSKRQILSAFCPPRLQPRPPAHQWDHLRRYEKCRRPE